MKKISVGAIAWSGRAASAPQPDAPRHRELLDVDSVGGQDVALALRHGALRAQHARAKDRTRGADLEGRRPRSLALGVFHHEERSRPVDHGNIAALEPHEVRLALGEHGVEDLRLQRREHEAGAASIAPRRLAGQQAPAGLRVIALAAEALCAEAVGHAEADEILEPALRPGDLRSIEVTHHDAEAIAAELPGAELVRVRRGLEHAHAGQRQAERRLRREPRHREPLGRHGDAVLAAGVAHVARAHTRRLRQLPGHLLGGALALLDEHEGVLAFARRRVERDLVDAKVLGRGAQEH